MRVKLEGEWEIWEKELFKEWVGLVEIMMVGWLWLVNLIVREVV